MRVRSRQEGFPQKSQSPLPQHQLSFALITRDMVEDESEKPPGRFSTKVSESTSSTPAPWSTLQRSVEAGVEAEEVHVRRTVCPGRALLSPATVTRSGPELTPIW